jgi:hypothetical protein
MALGELRACCTWSWSDDEPALHAYWHALCHLTVASAKDLRLTFHSTQRRHSMPDHTQSQASREQDAVVAREDGSVIVKIEAVRELKRRQPAKPVVKIGNQLEF